MLRIITVRKEGTVCSVCLNPIPVGEECFSFFGSYIAKNGELKVGHINVGNGQFHFRHFLCQYKTKLRKEDFAEYIKKVRLELEARSIKKGLENQKRIEKEIGRKLTEEDFKLGRKENE
jgi:hypothetical protein